jgi:16S rRNA processing protein RimM
VRGPQSSPPPESLVVMGRVRAPYGVRGWVKVEPFTEHPENLLDYREWWLSGPGGWQPRAVAEGRLHSGQLVVAFEGVDSPEAAAALRQLQVAIPREALPPRGEDEVYWVELLGSTVENTDGALLGRVEEVFSNGAQPLLRVNGEHERLIPFVDAVVRSVDVAGRRVVVDWGTDY